jgi:hypothetical protein
VANPGLVEHARELVAGQGRCQVDNRARDGGYGNAVPDRGVARVGATRSPRPDSTQPALAGRRYLGRRGSALRNPQEMRGRSAAQQRAVAAGANRRPDSAPRDSGRDGRRDRRPDAPGAALRFAGTAGSPRASVRPPATPAESRPHDSARPASPVPARPSYLVIASRSPSGALVGFAPAGAR